MADKIIGRSRNVNKNSTVSDPITMNSTTSTKIADANDARTFFRVDNCSSAHDVFIKLQAATVDDDEKGMCVLRDDYWEMPVDTIYTGEICGIAKTDSPEVTYTEY